MRIAYTSKKMSPARLAVVAQAEAICQQYQAQGLTLTLRQLYYQFVARGLLPNKQQEYKRLGDILNDARMAGALDWDYLVDRTRNLVAQSHWSSPSQIIDAVADQYRTDLWAAQNHRVEVWIEKDAGIGVIEGVCERNDVPYFSCRGYTSVSEIWASAMRIVRYIKAGDSVTILHIGDHDPSGLDMSRDIEDRLFTFIQKHVGGLIFGKFTVKRIALSYEQVEQYNPPPNPAKTTDSRFMKYFEDTGLDESWELDALDPSVLNDLIQDEIDLIKDPGVWAESFEEQERQRADLVAVSDQWFEVVEAFGSEAGA